MRINPHTISNSKLIVLPIERLEQADKDRIEAIRVSIMEEVEVDRFMFAETDLSTILIVGGKGVNAKKDYSELSQELKDELDWLNNLTLNNE
jgi:hypothetical protein